MKKKLMRSIFVGVLILSLFVPAASAAATDAKEKKDSQLKVEKMQKVGKDNLKYSYTKEERLKEKIEIEGEMVELCHTFLKPEKAFKNINKAFPTFIKNICTEYNLENFSIKTYHRFKEAFYMFTAKYEFEETDKRFDSMRCFFDMYDAKEQNDEAKKIVNQSKLKRSAIDKEELALYLPYNSKIAEEENEKVLKRKAAQTRAVGVNTTKAVQYATKYAVNPNYNDYFFANDGDCANFTSQILIAGGVKMAVYNDKAKGWWFKVNYGPNRWVSYSQTWVSANKFARYHGISGKTQNHYNFTKKIYKGDFIGVDWSSNGTIDHVGYVVQADNYVGSYGYYDYKVAQHTTNYIRWASSSNCGWDVPIKDGQRRTWCYIRA